MGTATPYQPNFINFLGDPNTPSTGLTPQMLQQIMASNGPPPGAPPPGAGMGGPGGGIDPRAALAAAMVKPDPMATPHGVGRFADAAGNSQPRWAEGGGGQNRGGYGTSAGGRY